MQNYVEITAQTTIEDSRLLILNNDKTIMSCHSGGTVPTTNLQVGMLFLNTSTWVLYQLKDATPTWTPIADLSKTYLSKEAADTYYALAGHNHSGVYQPADSTLTALAGITTAADRLPYFTGVDTANVAVLTSFARALLDDTSATIARTTLGVDSKVLNKTAAYTIVAGDRGKTIGCSGTFILSLTASATLGDGFEVKVHNNDTGEVTIEPASTETINSQTSFILKGGQSATLVCSGTSWYALKGGSTDGTLGSTGVIRTNGQTIDENITFLANTNGMSAGPITISTGYTVTIPTGSYWSIV